MAEITIVPVNDRRARRRFLTFPWKIYADDPLWVPPLLPERANRIDPASGAFFKRGTAELFIAYRDGVPAGTICAAEDDALNRRNGRQECIFGFFECIEDPEVARALVDRAQKWAIERRLKSLAGPFNLDYEDGYGVLIEGRDRPPTMLCGHTPAYYSTYLESLGFVPLRGDALAYEIDVEHPGPEFLRTERLLDRVRKRGWITLRTPDPREWQREIDVVQELLNRSTAHLQDYRPWEREAVESLIKPFAAIADPELVLFAEADGRTIGWFPGVPDVNEILIHLNGLRFPWDRARALFWRGHRPRTLAVKSVLVLPEYWGSGVALLLFHEMRTRAAAKGYHRVDLSLTTADNPYTPALAERMGARLYKRYRVYTRPVKAP